jgi:hypothetical protein
MARVPAEATAFAHRASRLMVNVAALYQRPEEAEVHQARIRQAYPGVDLGAAGRDQGPLDPTNLFHRNQNIAPTTTCPMTTTTRTQPRSRIAVHRRGTAPPRSADSTRSDRVVQHRT